MSEHRKINDDELEMLLHESLPYAENEMPVVTDELIDKTMAFIKKNTKPEEIPKADFDMDYGSPSNRHIPGKEAFNTHKTKSAKRHIGWIAGAAACFLITFAAVFAVQNNISKPDYNGSTTDVAMDDSSDSYEFTDGEASDAAYDDTAFDDTDFDDDEVSTDFSMDDSTEVSEETTAESSARISKETTAESSTTASEEASADSSTGTSEDSMTTKDNAIGESDEILFPDTVLGCSQDEITSILVKTSNGGTQTLTGYDIEAFCEEMEADFLSKKEEYRTVKKTYSELPNNWTKKTVIQLREKNSSDETMYYTIFTYKNGFAVCPFSPQESNPDLICVLYR